MTIDVERPGADEIEDLLRHEFRPGVGHRRHRQQDELVPSDAAYRVDLAEASDQTLSNGAQKPIADVIPVDVVGHLEIIEIQAYDRRISVRPSGLRIEPVESVEQERAIRQSSQ
ncbi:MAG TPA: hypothetical protein VGL48_10475 [Acidimicrobiales bacterium]